MVLETEQMVISSGIAVSDQHSPIKHYLYKASLDHAYCLPASDTSDENNALISTMIFSNTTRITTGGFGLQNPGIACDYQEGQQQRPTRKVPDRCHYVLTTLLINQITAHIQEIWID